MSLTLKKIYLDFQMHNVITVNAKQNDADSRYINITCTDHGKKVELDSSKVTAYVRYKKSDGKTVFNTTEILSDGTINVKLTQQMLAVSGRQKVDILIVTANGLSVDILEDEKTLEDLGVSVISTMMFYINVYPTVIEHSNVVSTDEFDALVKGVADLAATGKYMDDLKTSLESSESKRVEAETKREQNYQNTLEAITRAESATEYARAKASEAGSAATRANSAASSAERATSNANTAIERANEAAEACENIANGTNLVLKTDLYDSSNKVLNSKINTTFTSQSRSVITSGEALNVILGKIAAYMNAFENRQKILYSASNPTAEPDNSIGNNGDIYLKVIQE